MRIALDLRRIHNPGIGRYMRCLVEAMLAQESGHEFLLILPPDSPDATPPSPRAERISCTSKYYSLREQIELPRILRRHGADLLHSPHFVIPLASACPAIVTIHDAIYIACAEDLPSRLGRAYYRRMMTAAARRSVRVLTVSNFSKSDIVRRLDIDLEKIEVIHSGVSPAFQRITDSARLKQVRRKYSIDGEFILYVGIYKPRKNHAGLLRAFQKLTATGLAAQLVIAGPLGRGETELKRLARELDLEERLRFTGLVDDVELAALYSAARVYACPSLYEGFGFTVVEAMACGTPVVCSRETSLPEIAGEAALYADARNAEEFAGALFRAFFDEKLRAELIQKGYENCRRFSWDHAAAQTLDAYERSGVTAMGKAVCA
jgi:glycosyltransferase involved in cell wall biosynthesis